MRRERAGYSVGLLAAALFGMSAPVSKLLLADADPQLLAGLLYLGAFLAVIPLTRFRTHRRESPIRRADVPALAGLIISGGIVAPVLLMLGLERVTGIVGSLLLNVEGPLTLVVGVVVLHEFLSGKAWVGSGVVFAACAVLTVQGVHGTADAVGVTLVVGACIGWAIDNNLTQRLSVRDPFQIVACKTGIAAVVNIGLALGRGESLRSVGTFAAALALGAGAYGISIVLDAYALRILGAAREAAVFATAPFAGALLAVPLLGDSWNAIDIVAAGAMLLGVGVLVSDRHEHAHTHDALEHEHRHEHDEHHQHDHGSDVDAAGPHSHPHRHDPVTHAHRHVSDVHHRHPHPR